MAVFNNKAIHNHLLEENVKLNNNFMSPVNKITKLQTIKKPLDLFSTQREEVKNKGGLKMIDLFAGIGGIRQGFESIGCESVFSS